MVDIANNQPMKDIAILAYPGCMGTEVFALADVLLIANHLAAALEPGRKPPMAVRVVSARREPVRLAGGFVVQAQALRGATELLVVPGLEVSRFGQWDEKLALLDPEIALVRRRSARGLALASVCIGTFVLAAAGALDGRRATTAWPFEREFTARYPSVRLERQAVLCTDRAVITTGAVSSVFDLAVHLVEEHFGSRVARATAKVALVPGNRVSQQPYVDPSLIPTDRQSFAARVNRWMTVRLAQPYDLAALAQAFHVSTRTLLRRYKSEAGTTPLVALQQMRVAKAKEMLEGTSMGLAQIVGAVGYEDLATFSRLFARHAGQSPSQFRRQARAGRNKG
jgi:transcriptional regulator GlxA family with amidase domain